VCVTYYEDFQITTLIVSLSLVQASHDQGNRRDYSGALCMESGVLVFGVTCLLIRAADHLL
jgi:hypothetical protein